jgi:threonine/homoserine/homoserine lactone efflux protein
MPGIEILLPFTLASLALYVTPGADMAYIIARTVGHGFRTGIICALAVFVGILIHILAAGLGIAAILSTSQTAFMVIKYAGAAYLLYLAYRMVTVKPAIEVSTAQAPARHHRIFWEGVLINVLNPKISLFMLAFLPQFVDATKGSAFVQLLFLGLIFNVGGLIWSTFMVFSVSRFKKAQLQSVGSQKILKWLAASVFGGLAVRLALVDR